MEAFPHIAARIFGVAHTIEANAFRTILEGPAIARIISGEIPPETKGKKRSKARTMRLGALKNTEPVVVAGGVGEYALTDEGVAIVPVCGVLSRRFDWLTALCGWTTYEGLAATFEAMLVDSRVRAILMDVESPGGEAAGMLDISDRIIAARAEKPVWAVANTFAASAAYGVGGSAGRFLLPRLASVGSIGAVIVHRDQSQADARVGLAYTAIFSGDRKVDGWPHAAIGDEARAALQASVDHCRQEFADLVGRQGRMSAKDALATEAAMFSDAAAVEVGLADGIATFEQALEEITELAAGRPRNSGAAAATAAITEEKTMTQKPGDKTASEKTPEEIAAAAAAAAQPAAEAPEDDEDDKEKDKAKSKSKAKKAEKKDDDEKDDEDDYGADAVTETLELCALAGASIADARAFVSAKTPVAEVRKQLAARAAKASDDLQISTVPNHAPSSKTAGWDEAVAAVNKQMGVKAR